MTQVVESPVAREKISGILQRDGLEERLEEVGLNWRVRATRDERSLSTIITVLFWDGDPETPGAYASSIGFSIPDYETYIFESRAERLPEHIAEAVRLTAQAAILIVS